MNIGKRIISVILSVTILIALQLCGSSRGENDLWKYKNFNYRR